MGKIIIAETFASIQGEGSTQGAPSIFIRLGGCNLMCGGAGTERDKKLHAGATWRCDTIEVWRKGQATTVENLVELLEKQYEISKKIKHGWHIVITGGEPMMQQKAIVELCSNVNTRFNNCVVEIETNGTVAPIDELYCHIDLFNVSPKLSNSGMSLKQRKMTAGRFEKFKLNSCIFKFVISNDADLEEFKQDYGWIPNHLIYLMPAASTREELEGRSKWLAEECIKSGYNFSNRLQVQIWNETTGV